MRLNSLKEGEIVKITHPGSYDYERNYMLVVWPEKLNYIFSTKNEGGNTIKCYEADSIFVINLEGKLFVNGHFGYDTDCIVEKISTKEYKEISDLLKENGIIYNKKLKKIIKHESY